MEGFLWLEVTRKVTAFELEPYMTVEMFWSLGV